MSPTVHTPPNLPVDDGRPQVALPSSGIPTWTLALLAATFGIAMVVGLNQSTDRRVAMARQPYAAPAVPPLPTALDRSLGTMLGLAAIAPSERQASLRYDGRLPTPLPFAERPMPWPGGSGGKAFASDAPAAPVMGPNNEGSPAFTRYPTTPMPGGLQSQQGAPFSPAAGGGGAGGGSSIVYDTGAPAAAGEERAADGGIARATLIRNRPGTVAQGEILAATLETPVTSTRPGPIRAIIARDVRGFDGTRILIPRGSRLIGEYRADPSPGRKRILATWTRLIRRDGVAIRIDSPAADSLGATGLPGRVDSHVLARFVNATLQSALQIGVNLASRGGARSVIVTNAPQLSSAVGPVIPGADDPPTVSVRAGAAVSVFVARDLDFSGVPAVR